MERNRFSATNGDRCSTREESVARWLFSGFFYYLRIAIVLAAIGIAAGIAVESRLPAERRARAIVLLLAGAGALYVCCREFEQLVQGFREAVRSLRTQSSSSRRDRSDRLGSKE